MNGNLPPALRIAVLDLLNELVKGCYVLDSRDNRVMDLDRLQAKIVDARQAAETSDALQSGRYPDSNSGSEERS